MKAEVVVIGAGPAGMAAATTLADSGVETLVVDEQAAAGGQIYRAVERVGTHRPEDFVYLGEDYRAGLALVESFHASGAQFSPLTSVWDLSSGPQGPRLSISRNGEVQTLEPAQVVIATGAMERPAPFPGWTLPGVMGVGAAQILLKESGLIGEGRIVIAGTGPLVYLFAYQMVAAGAPPVLLLDSGPRGIDPGTLAALFTALPGGMADFARGLGWMHRIARAGVRRLGPITALRARGGERLEAIEYQYGGVRREEPADLLLVHDGVIPNAHLAMAAGCRHLWNPAQQCWAPQLSARGESTRQGISIIGDAGGIGGAKVALYAGALNGARVANRLGRLTDAELQRREDATGRALAPLARMRGFLDVKYPATAMFQLPAEEETLVCRCEEVTAGQIREVAAMGCVGPNQGKAFTRCGMGPCMGRLCGNTVSRIIADYHRLPMEEIGHYRIRPPVRPITVGQLADLGSVTE